MSNDVFVLEITEEGIEYWENYAKSCYSVLGSAFLLVLADRRQLKRHILEMEKVIKGLHETINEYRR